MRRRSRRASTLLEAARALTSGVSRSHGRRCGRARVLGAAPQHRGVIELAQELAIRTQRRSGELLDLHSPEVQQFSGVLDGEGCRLLGAGLFLLLGLLLFHGELGLIGRLGLLLAFGHLAKLPAQAELGAQLLTTLCRASLEEQKIGAPSAFLRARASALGPCPKPSARPERRGQTPASPPCLTGDPLAQPGGMLAELEPSSYCSAIQCERLFSA